MKKKLYESKAVWGAVIGGIGGIAVAIGNFYGLDLAWVPQVMMALGTALFGVGVRDALK